VPTWRAPAELTGNRLVLSTGRERDQWHTMTRTGHVPQLLKSCPAPYVAIHPSDAARLGLAQGDCADIISDARDAVRFEVKITEDVLPGSIFVPFHWGAHRHAGGAINTVLDTEADPRSGQPGLKFQAVRVRRAGL
jgi:anaerobic selenocysteine-containing dehydrogenase